MHQMSDFSLVFRYIENIFNTHIVILLNIALLKYFSTFIEIVENILPLSLNFPICSQVIYSEIILQMFNKLSRQL